LGGIMVYAAIDAILKRAAEDGGTVMGLVVGERSSDEQAYSLLVSSRRF